MDGRQTRLAPLTQADLLSLIQDLYASNKETQQFLHTRLSVGDNSLELYKKALDRWLWPDVMRGQDTSVAKAKQAISNYRKAATRPEWLN